MLILGRKENQKICFPELGISVQILRVHGSKVRLGIDAPMEVRIVRDELQDGASQRSRMIRLPDCGKTSAFPYASSWKRPMMY